jgi:hypothetical protein
VVAYKDSVFLNVPFDRSYKPLLEAAVFAIYDCGFVARCALEDDDSSRIRVDKIFDLISESKYGIHDISRVTLDHSHRLPRFNMPLELGLWLGARRFGGNRNKQKRALVLDRVPYRYQIFCSDIAGQDPKAHNNDAATLIRRIRNWLRNSPDYKQVAFPGADTMVNRYFRFRGQLPALCKDQGLNPKALEFNDYATLVVGWLIVNPK